MTFHSMFKAASQKNDSLVCVGLDTAPECLPKSLQGHPNSLLEFNKAIIEATSDLVCCYKPNIAFYEAEGISGLQQLEKTINFIKSYCPEIPVLLDAKRADIGSTAAKYAKAIFEHWGADAVTVVPHFGRQSVDPFLAYEDKTIFTWVRASSSDSQRLSELPVVGEPFYIRLVQEITSWDADNLGFIVGATYPQDLRHVRDLCEDSLILSPGFGAQGGVSSTAVTAGLDSFGGGLICNSSRKILYASSGKDFAEKARLETERFRDAINEARAPQLN